MLVHYAEDNARRVSGAFAQVIVFQCLGYGDNLSTVWTCSGKSTKRPYVDVCRLMPIECYTNTRKNLTACRSLRNL